MKLPRIGYAGRLAEGVSVHRDDYAMKTQSLERMSAAELLPVVYDELRRLAAARLRKEAHPEMQPTSLVHAAYVRLVGEAAQEARAWDGRGHFFGAAALAMRRILVERARQRGQLKRGGEWSRVDGEQLGESADEDPVDMLALDSALGELEAQQPDMYRVVMLRYFGGLSINDTASMLGTSPNTIKRRWAVARLWLLDRMEGENNRA